ncbi:helix-turn-helix transcriptional regulator [Enterococcus sp.]|uniref:helix-turn-helix domain-containing protein n=1 Tax=Enterococcus sp. TaxID=35783 RepID=UPI00291136FB|nr:helix-turn-helix transcriptional regulator [Enterococcus sp.]MDU5335816.1 helix-turn-helix transcriptional regulator [Enterococcus sp.]
MLILKEEKIIDPNNVIGRNIKRIRKEKGIGQTELVKMLQLNNVDITRETLVKIEGGRQHIKLEQLKGIKNILHLDYEALLNNIESSLEDSNGKI